jgi:hypothetical protein
MLFQSSDIDPPMGFSVPGNVAGSCATIVFDLAEFFGALGTHAAPDFGNPTSIGAATRRSFGRPNLLFNQYVN